MADEETQWSIDQIIIRASALYGVMPVESEMLAQFLSEEIKKIILNWGYSELTLNEILLALQMNLISHRWPSGVDVEKIELTGVFVSVKFLAEILEVYAKVRHLCVRTIENHLDGY